MKTLGEFQADIMMILSGVCGIMALFICMSNTMSRKRKHIMLLLEISAMFLLIADRRAYIHSGDMSTLGWWMTRISNFLVFFLNKDGKLTDEEFAQIKHHPEYGNQILSNIRQSPYLSIAAHYHHERFDGRGYPRGLVGEDIPEIARIIAVADSYDAMTSKRSYRDTIPQQKVREELVKGIGTQFDPQFAKIMLHLIDQDLEYSMRERETGLNDSFINRIHCERLYHDCSTGIPVNDKMVRIRADGQTVCEEARKIESSVLPRNSGAEEEEEKAGIPAMRSRQYGSKIICLSDFPTGTGLYRPS